MGSYFDAMTTFVYRVPYIWFLKRFYKITFPFAHEEEAVVLNDVKIDLSAF